MLPQIKVRKHHKSLPLALNGSDGRVFRPLICPLDLPTNKNRSSCCLSCSKNLRHIDFVHSVAQSRGINVPSYLHQHFVYTKSQIYRQLMETIIDVPQFRVDSRGGGPQSKPCQIYSFLFSLVCFVCVCNSTFFLPLVFNVICKVEMRDWIGWEREMLADH